MVYIVYIENYAFKSEKIDCISDGFKSHEAAHDFLINSKFTFEEYGLYSRDYDAALIVPVSELPIYQGLLAA